MSLPKELLHHALALINVHQVEINDAALRRSVSASYYAVFHQINQDAARLIAPNVPPETNHRIQRWFDHGEMKKICGRFIPAELSHPLLALIGPSASTELQTVARNFIELQDARHKADYDLGFVLTKTDSFHYLGLAFETFKEWESLSNSAEANIFVLSLLMWKNWEKDRQ